MALHAIVLGGGLLTPNDPLFDSAPGGHRSLIPIGGKSMAQWVIDALSGSESVQSITVMGTVHGKRTPFHQTPRFSSG